MVIESPGWPHPRSASSPFYQPLLTTSLSSENLILYEIIRKTAELIYDTKMEAPFTLDSNSEYNIVESWNNRSWKGRRGAGNQSHNHCYALPKLWIFFFYFK